MFVANGYTKENVESVMESEGGQREENELKSGVSVEYVRGASEKFRTIVNTAGYRVAFRSGVKVKDVQNKAKRSLGEKKNNVVYEIGCKCGKVVYKGETSQRMEERKKEHRDRERLTRQDLDMGRNLSAQLRMGKYDAGLTRHSLECESTIDWDGAKILAEERNTKKRKIKESMETMKEKLKGKRDVLNRCESLHDGYRSILKESLKQKGRLGENE